MESSRGQENTLTCPSSSCGPDAVLLGMVGSDGRVGYVTRPIFVSKVFIELVQKEEIPAERRFRFASTCVEAACAQWSDGGCSAIKSALADGRPGNAPTDRPRCGIRVSCRWFAQEGVQACAACPEIVTDATKTT
jgi:hypothetical protein